MKPFYLLTALLIAPIAMAGPKMASGYIKKDGTYVAPHMKSSPDAYKFNNYSSKTMGGKKSDELHPPKTTPTKTYTTPRKVK